MMIYIIALLLAFILVREYLFMHTTQKLLDRLMSRNYYDYQVSKSIPDQMSQSGQALNVPMQQEDLDLDLLNAQIRF